MSKSKYLTDIEREKAKERQKQRIKIANTVKRYNINNNCYICGNKGKIIHNYKDPYNIAFLCDNCRKDLTNLKTIEEHRINIEEIILNNLKENMVDKQVKRLPKEEIKVLVDEYLNKEISIGKFCNEKGISRHQFNTMVKLYSKEYQEIPIIEMVKEQAKRIQREIVSKPRINIV